MEMTLRWYGSKFDTVTLKQIRQIPGVRGVITTLYDTQPGEVWTREAIRAMKEEVEAAGLHVAGIESVNVHEDIKLGAPTAEKYIENYKSIRKAVKEFNYNEKIITIKPNSQQKRIYRKNEEFDE